MSENFDSKVSRDVFLIDFVFGTYFKPDSDVRIATVLVDRVAGAQLEAQKVRYHFTEKPAVTAPTFLHKLCCSLESLSFMSA